MIEDCVEYLVAIPLQDKDSDIRVAGGLPLEWIRGNSLNAVKYGVQYGQSARRTALLDVTEYLVNIRKRPCAISNLHPIPRRFQNVAAPASATSALLRASAMAARSSSVKT